MLSKVQKISPETTLKTNYAGHFLDNKLQNSSNEDQNTYKMRISPNKIIMSKEEQIFPKTSNNRRDYMEKVGGIKGWKW